MIALEEPIGTGSEGRGETPDDDEIVLKDGGTVRLRSLDPADESAVRTFFERLSPRSTRYRFFGARTELPSREIERLTNRDLRGTTALAAFATVDGEERIIAIAEFTPIGVEGADDGGPEDGVRVAEFAVAVADEHQDRGIGTLLLEQTALVARRAGMDELTAFVLSDNRRMLDVFEQSGFEVRGQRDGDECKVVFPTARTEHFLTVSAEREHLAARESVRVFFEPHSVAVVGVSARSGGIGRAIVENLVRSEFRGPIYPIGTNAKMASGLRCFPSLSAVGQQVDLVVVAVPAPRVEAVVAESAHVRARGVVVISSGFGEASAEGRARELRLRRLSRSAGMRLVGPNCMGVLNAGPGARLNATFSPVWPPSGNVALLSQSGALGIALLDHVARRNIGLSTFVSVGNRADVSVNDLLAYWSDDPATKVIALYLESLGNARKFARLAPEVARKKPIVAVKSGRTAAGTRAAASHSPALATLDVGVDALFAQAGVIRTNTLEELFDVVTLLSTEPLPKGPRVGVVTNAGGPGILLADACEARGLVLPSLSPFTVEALRALLPPHAGFSNPVDLLAAATPEQFEKAIALVGSDSAVDSVVVVYIPPLVTNPEDVAGAISRGAGALPVDKPLATVFMSSKGAPEVLGRGPRGAIPSYSFPENVALALSAAYRHSLFAKRAKGAVVTLPRRSERAIRRIVDDALRASADGSAWLAPWDAGRVLELAGIPYVPSAVVPPDPEEVVQAGKLLGYPLVLKAVATGLVHKTEVSGVVLGLESAEAARDAAVAMKTRVEAAGHPLEQYLVQKYVANGLESLVGVTTDPELGPIVVAALGGVHAELLGDAAFRLPPVSDLDASDMLDGLRSKRLFEGFRGAPAGDRRAVEDIVCRVSALVDIVPEMTELDLNPVKVLAPGEGAVVVDARIRLRKR